MPKWVLVIGTARLDDHEAKRRAYMVGVGLARAGFGLLTGSYAGVDAAAAQGFVTEATRIGFDVSGRFRQLWRPFWKRNGFWRGGSYKGRPNTRITVRDKADFYDRAISMSDAAIMIGGRKGSLNVARRFMDAGKPVFPIPFTGGQSDDVFLEILRGWGDNPIPGLTRHQALRLALPWTGGAGALIELLRGTLSDHPEIFISYRRSDSGSAVGRIQRDLADYFGNKRIFVDETRIEPSAVWRASIQDALSQCKVGLIVIGKQWFDPRLTNSADVLRQETSYLLENKVVLPLLVDDAGLPSPEQLPDDLKRLPTIQARAISNATWENVMLELIRTIENILNRQPVTSPCIGAAAKNPIAAG